jgi:beta-glucosidase
MKKRSFPVGRAILCAVLVVLIAGVNGAAWYFSGYLDNMCTVYEASSSNNEQVSYEEAIANGNDVSLRILEEGSVLLKNDNDTLPLAEGTTKVNLFGWRSSKMVFGGGGSGFVDDTDAISLEDALKEENIEVNQSLMKLYTDYNSDETASGVGETDFTITELPLSSYTDSVMEEAKAFSDTAIITVGRMGGEGNDLPTDMATVGGESGKHYLELSSDEEAMIKLVAENFDHVILLVNSSHAMELGFVEQYDIDAVLWIGCPGTNGLRGVVDVLLGQVSPSGRLVDTYAYDATSAPSFVNFGDFSYSNASEFYYVNYMEGIYVGYRYYETRGYTDGEDWYRSQVQYPFGYGLSYTTFEQRITSFVTVDDEIVMTVEVENTGDVAGKDVVQVYYTAPYTPGGIEKSYVNLAGFAKTETLEPGETGTVTISFQQEDMASYDDQKEGCYVLEEGEYEIKLMANAHDLIDSKTIHIPETIVYRGENKRSTDLVAAENQFDDVNVNFVDGHTYLSRSDWEGTWPSVDAAATEISEEDLEQIKNAYSDVYQLDGEELLSYYDDAPITTDHALTSDEITQVKEALHDALAQDSDALAELDAVEGMTTAEDSYSDLQQNYIKLQNGKLVFGLMRYFDYDSDVWDLLLSQMSVQEMSDLITMAGYRTAPVDSIEKSVTMDIDGPAGMQPFLGFGIDIQAGVGYPTEVTIASTWNLDLAEEMAQCVGQFANTQNVSGWYAPAMNAHRSPFAGRNFEYYSEDAFLAGSFGAAAVKGARSQGLWVYLKHFALCDQELHRDENGLLTFSNEQAIREIYLKPFEMSVKQGGATGVMSSFNRVGTTWCGASYPLCTTVLRNEWGFRGSVLTDFYMNWGSTYANAQIGVLAGNDLYLNPFQHEALTVEMINSSNQLAQAAKAACKNALYMTSRGTVNTMVPVSSWRSIWLYGNVAAGVVFVASVIFLILGIRKSKHQGTAAQIEVSAD